MVQCNKLLLITIAYVLAGKFGLSLAFVNESATAVWPPTGIALASLLIFGYSVWPSIFVGAFLVNLLTSGSLLASLGIAVGNTTEALLGAYLVIRFAHGRNAFGRPQDLFRFTVLAGILSTGVSAVIGVLSLCISGEAAWAEFVKVAFTWWLGDAAGALLVTPLLVLFLDKQTPPIKPAQVLELLLVLVSLFTVSQAVFSQSQPSAMLNRYPLEFLCIPLLIWCAFRFSQRETALAVFLLSAVSIWNTLIGLGPFALHTPHESLLILQAFNGIAAVTGMALAAAVSERRLVEGALKRTRDELEWRVTERTAELGLTNVELRNEIDVRGRIEAQLKQTNELLIQQQQKLLDTLHQHQMANEELRQTQLQLIQAAKMESVGRLAAGVAHEVKNPLATLLIGIDHLTDHFPSQDPDVATLLEDMHKAVVRADCVIKGLLNFSSPQSLSVAIGQLNTVIEESLVLVKHELDRNHVRVEKVLVENLPVFPMDGSKLKQVFVNLFMNAAHAMPEGGTLTVRTYVQRLTEVGQAVGRRRTDRFKVGETVIVSEVEDAGTGIPKDKLTKIFDPFFTTKPTGEGTGLGLTVSKKIIELHGGSISIENRQEGGVRARLLFAMKSPSDNGHGHNTHLLYS